MSGKADEYITTAPLDRLPRGEEDFGYGNEKKESLDDVSGERPQTDHDNRRKTDLVIDYSNWSVRRQGWVL
jgi:hypothetical protein